MTLDVIHASRSGANLRDHDGNTHWVWRDTVYGALHNAEKFGGTAQLTTGIVLTTTELVELTMQMDSAWTGRTA